MFRRKGVSIFLLAVVLVLGFLTPEVVSAGTYATCVECHALPLEQARGQMGMHGVYANPQWPETACNTCHMPVPHNGPSNPPGYWSGPLYPGITPPSITTQMCSSCHYGIQQVHEPIHSFDKIPMPLMRQSDGSPITLPTSILPLRQWDGVEDSYRGGLVCSTCHDPHDPSYQLPGGPSYLRIGSSAAGAQPLCSYCHAGGTPTVGHDLTIDSSSASVELTPFQDGQYDLQFTVRNRGNDVYSEGSYVFVETEDQFGARVPLEIVWLPTLYPDQSTPVALGWDATNWNGPVTFRFTLPASSLRPILGNRVIVRSFASPAAPTNLRVDSAPSPDSIALAWNPPAIPGVTFNVFRDGVKVNMEPIYSPFFWDAGLAPETPHTYTVQAVLSDGGLPSAMSNRVGGQTAAGFIKRVPEEYPTIQAAINAAAPGTSIHVAAGTYTESLFFNGKNQITVKGVDASGCILEAGGPGMVDLFSGNPNGPSYNTIAGFTLRNTELVLRSGTVAYGCIFTADPSRLQPVVFGSGFIANSVFDTYNSAIAAPPIPPPPGFGPGECLTLANCILRGDEPIDPPYQPQPAILLLNNLFEVYGFWQNLPGEQNIVGDPGFCPGSYFLSSYNSPCVDHGTSLGMMTPGLPDIGAFEYGVPYTPRPPSGLSGSRQPGSPLLTDVHLSWAPPAGAECSPPTEYLVYRSTVPDFPAASLSTPIATVPEYWTSFVDYGVPREQVFYYQVRAFNGWGPEGQLVSAPSNTVVIVAQPNAPPVAVDDAVTTPEDQPIVVLPQGNDSDPDGDPTFIVGNTLPAHGSLTFDGLYGFNYTPLPNFNGTDSFIYSIQDGWGRIASATVTITVTPVNDSPVAAADSATTLEDGTVTIPVLANDTDLDGETLNITVVSQGQHGTVMINGGSVVYTPTANYAGPDSFNYTISDPSGSLSSAPVSVTVTPVNDDPVAVADSKTMLEDSVATITVLTNDSDLEGDALAIASITQGAHGSVAIAGAAVVYTPVANFNGADSFTYTVSDGKGGSATASVSITVTAVNDIPVAVDGTATTDEGTVVGITLIVSDLDGDPLSYTVVAAPAHGTLSGTAPHLAYTPSTGYFGADSFTFVANDGVIDSNTARVSVTINPGQRRVSAAAGAGGIISPSGTLTVPYNSVQLFTVMPNAGYSIAAVTGCGGTLSGATYTTDPITADCTVAASFAINSYSLAVTKAGTGGGTVTSAPAGINCGSICSANYDYGSSVTLTASSAANSFFTGWSGGGCSGTGACTVMMTAVKTVTATFTQGLTVTVPNGGESWKRGSSYTIRWTYAGTPGSFVKIELLKGGSLNKTISSSSSSGSNGVGSYSWKIPSSQAVASDYTIRVTSISKSNFTDSSNGNFSVINK